MQITTQRTERFDWVDYAKGIAIFLVVYGHVLIGTYNAKLNIPYSFYIYSLKFIYSFHMPAFFFLSGMFVNRSWSSFNNFLWQKTQTIAYPYFVWSVIQGGIYAIMSPYTNFKFNLIDLPSAIAFEPLIQFWFLYALFVHHILFALLKKIVKPVILIALIIAILMYLSSYYLNSSLAQQILKFFLFYVLGAFWSKFLLEKDWMQLDGIQILILLIAFIFGQSMFLQLNGSIDDNGGAVKNFLMAGLGIGVILCASLYLSKKKIANFIRELGILSMPIYLTHILAAVGTRIVLQKVFAITAPGIHIIMGISIGLLLPILLYLFMQRLKFPYLFSLKAR